MIQLLVSQRVQSCDWAPRKRTSTENIRAVRPADMASGLAAFISNRTTRFESDRGAVMLLLLCVNWCPVTIYLHAIMRQLQYVDGFDRQFLLRAAHMRLLQYVDSAGNFCCWLRIFAIKHLAWQKCQFTFSIPWRCSNATAARCINSALTSNKQKPVVTTLNTVRIIIYFSTPKRIPRRK